MPAGCTCRGSKSTAQMAKWQTGNLQLAIGNWQPAKVATASEGVFDYCQTLIICARFGARLLFL